MSRCQEPSEEGIVREAQAPWSANRARSSLAEIAWAYQIEQLRARQQAGQAESPDEKARDVVLAAYWP